MEGPEEFAPDTPAEPEFVAGFARNVTFRMALVMLDEVDPAVVFRQRAAVMKSVPHFLRGPFRKGPFRNALNWRWKKLLRAIVATMK